MFFRIPRRRGYSQNYLIHLLLRDWKFRLALSLVACIILSLSILLPKVWRVSPAGYLPVSKISGLDFLQAWSLKRQALKQASEKRYDLAISSWNACIANRPFDAAVLRDALATFRQLTSPTWRHILQVRYYGQMLAALAPHQHNELALVAQTLLSMGEVTEAANLSPPSLQSVEDEKRALFGALYLLDDRILPPEWFESFKLGSTHQDSMAQEILSAYEFLNTLNQVGSSQSERFSLQDVKLPEKEKASDVSLHLGFQLAFKAGDFDALTGYFDELKSRELARSWHLLKKWRLQLGGDQITRVWSEIRHEDELPLLNSDQVLELAGIYLDISKTTACQDMLESWLEEFPSATSLWVLQGELLLKSENWDRVRAFAGRIRNEPSLGNLEGYACFMEGEGFRRSGNLSRAASALNQWENSPVVMPSLDLRMARHARNVGMVERALRRFLILEPHFEDHQGFWQELFEFAHEQGQTKFLLRAARKLHELSPRSPQHANNYAAVMLALRENPSEAIGFTLSLVKEFPSDLISRINHIHALLQNRRLQDAQDYLSSIDRESLVEEFRPAFDLAVFELHCLESNLEQARDVLQIMEVEKLLPPQQVWVRDTVKRLELPQGAVSEDL